MPPLLPPPVFADAGAVVGLLVLIFTVVGWLVNLANSQNNPPAPPQNRPRPPRPREDRVQNEIDIFLQEVRGEKLADDDVVMEVPPPEPRRRGTPPRLRRPLFPSRNPRPFRDSGAGWGTSRPTWIRTWAKRFPAITWKTTWASCARCMETPNARLAAEMAALESRGTAKQPPLSIIGLLRDQQGIRQAILVNEILSKPKSLREE